MDFNKEELETFLDVAFWFKRQAAVGVFPKLLEGKTLGMLFAKPSTRTRVSFEVAMTQLGGHAQFYDPEHLQLKNKETMEDTARVLSRYIDGIMIRLYGLEKYGDARKILRTIADNATIPVINALDDKEHPCQIMADIMTMIEKFGDLKGKKIVMSWAYSERIKSAGVPQTMAIAASILGFDLVLAYPPKYDVDPEYLEFARKAAEKSGAKIEITHDIYEAARDAHVIYAKSWGSFQMTKEEDKEYRRQFKEDWCISDRHFENADPNAVFMHCLPADRGLEVTNELIDGERSIVYDEAENRLHVQKAILALIM
jgi:ornithine carbamoyltransferase